jgi:phenylalanyl-tRNA synthetase beta chain
MACELDLAEILAGAAPGGRPKPLAQFPAARRDLSLVVEDGLPYERIEQTLSGAGLENLEEIDYVTTFRGKALEAGKKSVSVALVFRSETGTLTGEQVEAAVVKAVAAAGEKIGATLRS